MPAYGKETQFISPEVPKDPTDYVFIMCIYLCFFFLNSFVYVSAKFNENFVAELNYSSKIFLLFTFCLSLYILYYH